MMLIEKNSHDLVAKLKNITISGIYVCICHFFFVILRAEMWMDNHKRSEVYFV